MAKKSLPLNSKNDDCESTSKMNLVDEECNKRYFGDSTSHRRAFISALLISGTGAAVVVPSQATVFAQSQNDSATMDSCLWPSTADSIALYLQLLNKLPRGLVNPYMQFVANLGDRLSAKYGTLLKLVDDLENEVPKLKENQKVSRVKNGIKLAQTGAFNINNLANAGPSVLAAQVSLIAQVSESLNYSGNDTIEQDDSIVLSPKAVRILRSLLREIRQLDPPIQQIKAASAALRDLQTLINNRIDNIEKKLYQVIKIIVTAQPSTSWRDSAVDLLKLVVNDLRELDLEYSKAILLMPKEDRRDFTDTEPTKVLRSLLLGTVAMVSQGKQAYEKSYPMNQVARMIPASMGANTSGANTSVRGLREVVHEVLSRILLEPLRLRVYTCVALIAPILAAYQGEQRKRLIREVIEYIYPDGEFDRNPERKELATEELSKANL